MATYTWTRDEALALIELAKKELVPEGAADYTKHGRMHSGTGWLTLRIETDDGRTITGQISEIEGPSCPEGLTIATTLEPPPGSASVEWEEIVWLGFGFAH